MKYATVCSGIEAPSMAWHPLGWEPVWFSEIDRFPSAVLKHHYPSVPNLGDMTKIKQHETFKKSIGTIDLFCGGTPCQSFSVAGLRKGMDDPRGNLALVFLGIVDQLRPRWVVWENVPGVLSSNGGRDFGAFLGALGQLRYGWAYRVLDAQYFGVPQRRRRVFVVGHLGGWQRAAAVLFERHSLQGHPAPSREAGQGFADGVAIGIDEECNATKNGFGPLLRGGQGGTRQAVAYDLRGRENGAQLEGPKYTANIRASSGGSSRSYVFTQNSRDEVRYIGGDGQIVGALAAETGMKQQNYLCSIMPQNSGKDYKARKCEVTQPLTTNGHYAGNQGGDIIQNQMQVRRLTPRECERLQGFPDDYTRIPYRGKSASQCPDGPRYKALGNSMAVPVMRWIGERIQKIDAI